MKFSITAELYREVKIMIYSFSKFENKTMERQEDDKKENKRLVRAQQLLFEAVVILVIPGNSL